MHVWVEGKDIETPKDLKAAALSYPNLSGARATGTPANARGRVLGVRRTWHDDGDDDDDEIDNDAERDDDDNNDDDTESDDDDDDDDQARASCNSVGAADFGEALAMLWAVALIPVAAMGSSSWRFFLPLFFRAWGVAASSSSKSREVASGRPGTRSVLGSATWVGVCREGGLLQESVYSRTKVCV